jgi:hypothetical protein
LSAGVLNLFDSGEVGAILVAEFGWGCMTE